MQAYTFLKRNNLYYKMNSIVRTSWNQWLQQHSNPQLENFVLSEKHSQVLLPFQQPQNKKPFHFQSTILFPVQKSHHIANMSKQVVEQISTFQKEEEVFSQIEPSTNPVNQFEFLNFTVSSTWMEQFLKNSLLFFQNQSSILHQQKEQEAKPKIIVDFSSPNLAKEMHVGHLRSTILGDTICRIFEFTNEFNVVRMNHVGDFGTQFGMLIAYLKHFQPTQYQQILNWKKEEQEALDEEWKISNFQTWYQKAKKEFDVNEEFRKQAHEEVVLLQKDKHPHSIQVWKFLCELSHLENERIYQKLGVKLMTRGESFYEPFIPQVLEHCKDKTQISEGALIFALPHVHKFPLILQKSDGGYTYDTTDLAAIWQRLFIEKAQRLIYVVDNGQEPHFQLVFEAAKEMQWNNLNQRLDYVGFGVVSNEDGKKFKTREGDSVKLDSLLAEAIRRAADVIKARDQKRVEENPNLTPLGDEELQHASKVIGYGAIKYADLKTNRRTNYKFSFEKMLDFRGNTAVYLLYAYARLKSIIRNVTQVKGADISQCKPEDRIFLDHPSEMNLALHLCKFVNVLDKVMDTLEPHLLCEYLYDLSNIFNCFYRDCSVLNAGSADLEKSRLLLCCYTEMIMKHCFTLLGLDTLDRI